MPAGSRALPDRPCGSARTQPGLALEAGRAARPAARRRGGVPVEGLDPAEPIQDCACLVHDAERTRAERACLCSVCAQCADREAGSGATVGRGRRGASRPGSGAAPRGRRARAPRRAKTGRDRRSPPPRRRPPAAEPVEDRRALARCLTENGSRTQRRGEQPLAAAQQRRERARSCSEAKGSVWKSESSHRSSASPRSRSSSAAERCSRSRRARSARTGSAGRLAGRRRRRDRQHRTNPVAASRAARRDRPAAIAPAVASRSAVIASASSPGASGTPEPEADASPSSASSSRTQSRCRLTLEPLREQPSCLRPVRQARPRRHGERGARRRDRRPLPPRHRRAARSRRTRVASRRARPRTPRTHGRRPSRPSRSRRRPPSPPERRSTVVSASRSSAGHWSAPARRPPPPLAPARRAPAGHPRRREPPCAGVEEGLHQRPVLVQRRASGRLVLLERERDVSAVVELVANGRERPEAERAACGAGSATGSPVHLRARSPCPLPRLADGAPIGRAVRGRPGRGLDRRPTSRHRPGPAVDHAPSRPVSHGAASGRAASSSTARSSRSDVSPTRRRERRAPARAPPPPHAPDPGDEPLVKQGIADLAAAAGERGSRPSDRGPAVARGCPVRAGVARACSARAPGRPITPPRVLAHAARARVVPA